eukprot:CAMPEP_0119390096 /NCGR_PEP_ID=MMETSP1334-20130426/111921_1 /TAXON_ID=127549 /ORGANISM="Calcidiscus leptoporus, Strain RCC1130" /LENGTH=209 /DNA_ID=CAMNT_0007412497 /DNA_START=84 /DNA_END=713 /DNA_ORIENTATION=-
MSVAASYRSGGAVRRLRLSSLSAVDANEHRPYGWAELALHARNQSARYAAGEYPGRSSSGTAEYAVYKRWCSARSMSNEQYVLRYVRWRAGGVALEPALAPYLLEHGLEHWILWHHPEAAKSDTVLQPESEAALALALFDAEGVRLTRNDLVCFQNIPQLRSLPTIPHSHVFVRKQDLSNVARRALQASRSSWRERSPWLGSGMRGAGG